MLRRLLVFVPGLLALAADGRAATPAAPPPPATYDVRIRYQINAFPTQRIPQYYAMMRTLKRLGFVRDPAETVPDTEAADMKYTTLRGTIPSANARRILDESHIQDILLVPHGDKLPAAGTPVRVDLELASGLPANRQRALRMQTRTALTALGFVEAVGYDRRGDTRLLGAIDAGRLDALFKGLRKQPAAAELGPPFSRVVALRVITALPKMPVFRPRPAPAAVPKGQEKASPDLRAVLADAARATKATRLEVILAVTPGPLDSTWIGPLREALPGLVIEGRLGPLVTVVAAPRATVLALGAVPEVAAIRLPRAPVTAMTPGKATKFEPMRATGLVTLHAMGRRGAGTRVAIVADDFRGWQAEVGKGLPEDTRLVDLTAERNGDLLPDPLPAGAGAGSGTRCALTVARAAPAAQLTLVRVDATAPYMLEIVARAINGEGYRTLSLAQRAADLEGDRRVLDRRQDALLEERRVVFSDFRIEGEAVARRKEYLKKQKQFDADEAAYRARLGRYLRLQQAVLGLKGVRVVASGLVWPDGYPVDGSSTLSRYFDDRPFRAALWFQAAGDTRGQAWAGLFRDADRNGIMEFAAVGAASRAAPPGPARLAGPTSADSWTSELNFLAWQPAAGPLARNLPAGARLRVSLQWREAHDRYYARVGEDPYRVPLAQLRLVLLYQPDPAGKTRPADDLEVVAQSTGRPQRLNRTASAATYEQTLEFTVDRPGRYALRVEGLPPEGVEPAGSPALPSARRRGELRPRLFVRTLAGAGRAVLSDYRTRVGSLGMPADAHRVIAVGAADDRGRAEAYSADGPPYNLELLPKPDVLAYDRGGGTAEATCFAAGLAASSLSAGMSLYRGLESLRTRPGGVVRVPPTVLRR